MTSGLLADGCVVETGPGVLDRLAPALDELHEAASAPVTARRPWLQTWLDETPAFTPLVIGVGSARRLDAVAALAMRRVGPLVSVVDIGHGPSDYQVFPARDTVAADALATRVADVLRGLRRPWVLRVDQLPDGDPVAQALTRRLRHARLSPGMGAPAARLGESRDVSAYLSRNAREAVRKARARLRREQLEFSVTVLRDPDAVAGELERVADLKRRRDLQVRGHSSVDVDRDLAMWRRLAVGHAARGEAELVLGHIGDRLAAYLLVFLDKGAYRIWDVRFEPELHRFAPGRLIARAAFQRVLGDPELVELDWMNGEEPYKLSMSNVVVPHTELRAWSSRSMHAVDDWLTRRRAAGASAPGAGDGTATGDERPRDQEGT
jgi:CelD/BcsL family acetyltransferase involved in cellulose biosynthesis